MDTMTDTVHRIEAAVKPHLRGVLHEVAFAVSLVTGTVIVCLAEGPRERVAASVYAASVVLLFGTSAAYHRGSWCRYRGSGSRNSRRWCSVCTARWGRSTSIAAGW